MNNRLDISEIFLNGPKTQIKKKKKKKKKIFNMSIFLPVNVCKTVGWVANSVDPDQTLRSAASDLGLLFAQACLSECAR